MEHNEHQSDALATLVRKHLAQANKSRYSIIRELEEEHGMAYYDARILVARIANEDSATPVAEKKNTDQPPATPYQSAHHRARVAIAMLIIITIFTGVAIAASIAERDLLQQIKNDETVTQIQIDESDERQLAIAIGQAGLLLISAVTFLRWMHLAYRNLPAFGIVGLRFSPAWTWKGFVIPILNLYRPYEVMSEIWRASGSSSTPWKQREVDALVKWWWGSWIVINVIGRGLGRYFRGSDSIDQLLNANVVTIILDGLTIFSAALAMLLIWTLTQRQEQTLTIMTTQHENTGQPEPPHSAQAPPSPAQHWKWLGSVIVLSIIAGVFALLVFTSTGTSYIAEKFVIQGDAHAENGEYTEALKEYNRAIETDPNYAVAYNARGFVYRRQGLYTLALADYTTAIELDPEYETAYNNRCLAHYYLADYASALADCNRAIQLHSEFARFYNNRGLVYKAQGEYDLALADYNHAIQLNADYALAYNNRAMVYYAQADYEVAIENFSTAIDLDPMLYLAFYNRAKTYHNLGNYERALADYDRALDLNPTDAAIYDDRGILYENQGAYDLALADYQQAIELDPWFASPYWGLGNIYYDREQFNEARQHYQRYLDLAGDSAHWQVIDRVAELEALQNDQ